MFLATGAALLAGPAFAIDPIAKPTATPLLKLGLAAYSFRDELDLKKKTWSLFDFIDFTATLPFDCVELTSYYFADTSDAYIAKLKGHCTRLGLDISGVPARSTFTHRDDGKRKAEIEHVKLWLNVAAKLGAKSVRVFAGNVEKGDTDDAATKRVIASLEDCCDTAAKLGVFVALENHGGITATADGILALIQGVKSDHFGVNVDTGNFKTADPYADVAKIAPYGVNVQVKTEVFPAGGAKGEADLKRYVQILKDAKYRGPVILEYEAAENAMKAVPRYAAELRKLVG
jgi:sugar phosphate isomerase/epimerase